MSRTTATGQKTETAAALPDGAACLNCGYLLRGLPDPVCPECGDAFDPTDRRTFRDAADLQWWTRCMVRWACAPPGWHSGLMLAVTAGVLWWMAWSVWPFLPQQAGNRFLDYSLPLVLPGAIILLPLLLSHGLRVLACRQFHRPGHSWKRKAWYITPACMVMLALAGLYPWPTAAAVLVSRPFLHDVVNSTKPGQRPEMNEWVGLFRVKRANSDEPGRVILVVNAQFDIVHDVRPVPESSHYALSLGSGWYIWGGGAPMWARWPRPARTSAFPSNPLIELILGLN